MLVQVVNWQGDFATGNSKNSRFRPRVRLGVRQNLTGNEIDSKLYFLGQNFETQTSEDSISTLLNATIK